MRKIVLIAALGALLATALATAAYLWWRMAEVEMGVHGILALILGALLSLLLGGGLMALVFYSSRHGHDEAAGETPELPRTGRRQRGADGADDPPAA